MFIFHSLASTHHIYDRNAFDNYDIIFSNGDYQFHEIKKEKIDNLIAKRLYQQVIST